MTTPISAEAVTSSTDVVRRHHVTTTGPAGAPVLLFAHGFGCDQEMWSRVLPAFSEGYRVVVYDHVGAGRSDLSAYDPTRYASLDGYAEDLLILCEAMDLRDVTVIAHSVAAMMALTAAVRSPTRFARLVLLAPSPCYIDDPDQGYIGGFSSTDIDELLQSLDSNYFAWATAMAPVVMGNPDAPELGGHLASSFCRTDPDIARDFARVTFRSDCRPLLAQVTVPCLVLQCAQDALAPLQVGDYLHAQLSGSTLVRLDATGHCPHVSAPEETVTAIQHYLSTHDPLPGQ